MLAVLGDDPATKPIRHGAVLAPLGHGGHVPLEGQLLVARDHPSTTWVHGDFAGAEDAGLLTDHRTRLGIGSQFRHVHDVLDPLEGVLVVVIGAIIYGIVYKLLLCVALSKNTKITGRENDQLFS